MEGDRGMTSFIYNEVCQRKPYYIWIVKPHAQQPIIIDFAKYANVYDLSIEEKRSAVCKFFDAKYIGVDRLRKIGDKPSSLDYLINIDIDKFQVLKDELYKNEASNAWHVYIE